MDKIRLSRRTVDALTPKASKYYAWDTSIAGFGVKVLPSGRKTFVFKYRAGGGRAGKSREPVIGQDGALSPDQARKIAKTWAAEVAMGQDPAADRRASQSEPVMHELFERYLSDHAEKHKKARSVYEDRKLISALLEPTFGRNRVKDVSRGDVSRWHARLHKTPYRANRALACLSKAFSLAEIWGLRETGSNPCIGVTKFKEEKRKRYLSPDEYSALFGALDAAAAGELRTSKGSRLSQIACLAIRLLVLTGARKSEILGLEWDWIDQNDGFADLPDSKTGARRLYFDDGALAVLETAAQFRDGPFVFPGAQPGKPLMDIKKSWDVIRTAAKITDVRLHDLRHSYASVGVASGMSLPQIGKLLGHSSPQTTARYAHLADEVQHHSAGMIGAQLAARNPKSV